MVSRKEKKKSIKKTAIEIILILASVLIFRGMWTLMDKLNIMSDVTGLLISVILGTAVASVAFYMYHCCDK